jgi:hypothetical protein
MLGITIGLIIWIHRLHKRIRVQDEDVHELHSQISELMKIKQEGRS